MSFVDMLRFGEGKILILSADIDGYLYNNVLEIAGCSGST